MTDRQHDDAGAASSCGCSDTQLQRIHEYLDGALTVEDVQEIADHLEQCPDCTHEHDLEQFIRSAVKRSCTETAPETLRSSIIAKIHEACGEPGSTGDSPADAGSAADGPGAGERSAQRSRTA